MFYIPAFDGSWAHWTCLSLLLSAPVFFALESRGAWNMGYSKFADRTASFAVPSRVGMLLVYAPAVVLCPLVLYAHGGPWTAWHGITSALISLHFLKRCLEVLYLHKYSGVMNLSSVVMICALYSLLSVLVGQIAATEIDAALLASDAFNPAYVLGISLWLGGTAGNFFHHYVLATLRAPGETRYKLPTAGLFRWVACPHYLTELIAWWGFALVFHHVGAAIIALTMSAYLFGRADSTLRWYRARLGPVVPRDWRRILPGFY